MEMFSWADRVKNEVLQRVREERHFLLTIKRRLENWIGHILRRNFLLKHVTDEKIEGTGRRGRRRKQLLDDLKETRRYCKLKEVAFSGQHPLQKAMDPS
jgi:hypothetical protein